MNNKLFFAFALVFVLLSTPAYAADEITITYEQAHVNGDYRFWYGQGELSSDVGETFTLDLGDSQPVAYSSKFQPVQKEGSKVTFASQGVSRFEYAFLSPKPSGHGIYKISMSLPKVSREKELEIRIENAEKIIYSNVDFDVQQEGEYLVLKSKTDERDLTLLYITKLSYMAFANSLATIVFMLGLMGYMLLHRRDIKKLKLGSWLRKPKSPVKVEGEEDQYNVSFDLRALKILDYKEGRLSVKVPMVVIYAVFVIFLLAVFVSSLLSPMGKIWGLLGGLKFVVIAMGGLFAILSLIYIASAKDEKGTIKRISIIGGGIVWIRFGYLEFLGLALGVITSLLIYFLSVLVLEEEA